MKDKTLNAVYEEELPRFLKSIGQWDKIESGEVFCCICHEPISLEKLQLVIPLADNQFKFVCSRPDCVEQYYEQECNI
jgi:RNA polymerase-binding transcription factor DksA